MSDAAPRVSVLLVTRDGMAALPATLDALARQRTDFPFEVVAVDSGSRDGTADLLAARADRLVAIAPREFDHGATRNLGVAACRGELVVLLVQDALPAADDWLAQLVAPLWADASLAGTYARQLPRPEASALSRYYLALWHAAASAPRVQELAGADELAALTPAERHARCTFDNVCSCLRRSVWERIPFRPTPIAEDLEWGREVLLAGWRLRYTPEAAVFHSHERSPGYELARARAAHARLVALFGLRTIPSRRCLLRAWSADLRLHWRLTKGRRRELPRALALAIAMPLGQYLGGCDAGRASAAAAQASAAAAVEAR